MSTIVTGIVKNGVVVPNASLPEGAFVEIHVHDRSLEVPPELQAELAAWQRASANALEFVDRMTQEMGAAAPVAPVEPVPGGVPTPAELRRMPREQRQALLAAAAALAEQDYNTDKELTGFEAFSEEELNDD